MMALSLVFEYKSYLFLHFQDVEFYSSEVPISFVNKNFDLKFNGSLSLTGLRSGELSIEAKDIVALWHLLIVRFVLSSLRSNF